MRRQLAPSLLALALVSCEYAAGVAPPVTPRIAVHSVLNAGAADEVVLVERTLVDGRQCVPVLVAPTVPVEIATCTTDRDDPIVSGGGEPISNAEVVIYGPAGDSAVALEDVARRGDGKGAGVYRFTNRALDGSHPLGAAASLAVVPGGTYRLRVTTALGTATARTTIPSAPVVSAVAPFSFNMERGDIVRRSAVAAVGAAGYLAVLDRSLGPRLQRLFDAPPGLLAFAGSLFAGNIDTPTRDSRFQTDLFPGLPFEARVSALDTNYVRALRAGSDEDPFSSENPGNSIEGGVGLFGSLVPTSLIHLDVISFVDEPIEGRYVIAEGPSQAPREMRIFAYRGGLSGSFLGTDGPAPVLYGSRAVGAPTRLEFFSDRFDAVHLGTFEGRLNSGELRGTFTREGQETGLTTVYVRQP